MRIVLATQSFAGPGGTESYVRTVATELDRLGHDVVVVAQEGGPAADAARAEGLAVEVGTAGPPEADAVLAQDVASAYEQRARHPGVPLVVVVHSALYEFQMPPRLEGVADAVVVLSDRFAARVRAQAADVPLHRLRQPVDLVRFAPAGELPERPRRALVLSNYLRGHRLEAVREALAARGIACVTAGAFSELSLAPETLVREVDVVIGKGRVVVEALACGRAAYVLDVFGCDGWVTPEAYPAFEADAFAGLATGRRPDVAGLVADLDGYDRRLGDAGRDLAVTHHSAVRHAVALVDLLRGLGARGGGPDAAGELARLSRELWQAQRRAMGLMLELERREQDRQHHHAMELRYEAEVAREREAVAALRAQLDDVRSRG